jgi:hypothetical protein
MNEFLTLISIYHLFCLTDWVGDANMFFLIGWSQILIVSIVFVTNFGMILHGVINAWIAKHKFNTRRKRFLAAMLPVKGIVNKEKIKQWN